MAGSLRTERIGFGAVCVFVAAVALWNVARYPPGLGYDADDHRSYADGLVPGGHVPHGVGEYYTPPGYYALAGSADWLARTLGAHDPAAYRAGMLLGAAALVGTVAVVRALALELWPGRDRIALGAAAFVALAPVTVKAAAMFHPEPVALFVAVVALWLAVRTLRDGRFAPALGVALGVGQLVQAALLWTALVALVALAVARRWRELALVVVVAALIPLPWYVHQGTTYSGNPLFPRPATAQARKGNTLSGRPKFVLARRPARFYVDPGLPDVVSAPHAPHFRNLLLPTTYSELWGDYFGVWRWRSGPNGGISSGARVELTVQSLAGAVPTLLAVVGWLALLRRSLRRPAHLAVALLPLVGLLSYLAFVVAYPTPDGDVLKATYMLTTAGAWALAFGYALDRLRGRSWPLLAALVGVCALANVPFLVYR